MRILVAFFFIFVLEFTVAASIMTDNKPKSKSYLLSPPKVHHLIRSHNDEIYSIFEKHEIQKRQQFGPGFPDSAAPACECYCLCDLSKEDCVEGKCVTRKPTSDSYAFG